MKPQNNVTAIVRWIKDKLSSSHLRGCVVGLSGGLDSAVVSALVKKAVGRNHLCLVMPCGSSPSDMKDALAVAKKFRLNYHIVDISPIYNSFIKTLNTPSISDNLALKKPWTTLSDTLSRANLKSRIRMSLLYYFANYLNYLVVGTSNKSELSVGYFTKYGDGAADILPLSNFYKSEVRALGRHLGVPVSVIEKPPSAGLWEGQTDEGEMGVTYDELEKILRAFLPVPKNRIVHVPKSFPSEIDKFLVKKVIAMYNNSAHKRAMPEGFNPREKKQRM